MMTAEQGTRVPTIEVNLGIRMAAARKDAGITQDQMSKMLGCNRRTITRWESNSITPPPAVVIAYSVATDVNLGWIQSGEVGRFSSDWDAWYTVRPEGFEPPAYWSVAAIPSEKAFWGLAS